MKEQTKKITIGILGFLALLIILSGIYTAARPAASRNLKDISIVVIHGDGSTKEFQYHTEEQYLGGLLQYEGLVEGNTGAYGLFITAADGEMADDSRQQWWCITKAGETVNTSADTTPLSDGDTFELTLTEGY